MIITGVIRQCTKQRPERHIPNLSNNLFISQLYTLKDKFASKTLISSQFYRKATDDEK